MTDTDRILITIISQYLAALNLAIVATRSLWTTLSAAHKLLLPQIAKLKPHQINFLVVSTADYEFANSFIEFAHQCISTHVGCLDTERLVGESLYS